MRTKKPAAMAGAALAALVAAGSIGVGPVDAATTAADVRDASDNFEQVFAENDGRALADLYRRNGRLRLLDGNVVGGPKTITTIWDEAFDDGFDTIDLDTDRIRERRGRFFQTGTYVIDVDGGPDVSGSFRIVWRPDASGDLEIFRNEFNS